jgi:hypothetical protein
VWYSKRNSGDTRHVPKLGILVLVVATAACGYEPVYGGERPAVRLSVDAAPHGTPHLEAVQAAISGMRRSLSQAGVLRPGRGYPRVVVEVLPLAIPSRWRADQRSVSWAEPGWKKPRTDARRATRATCAGSSIMVRPLIPVRNSSATPRRCVPPPTRSGKRSAGVSWVNRRLRSSQCRACPRQTQRPIDFLNRLASANMSTLANT